MKSWNIPGSFNHKNGYPDGKTDSINTFIFKDSFYVQMKLETTDYKLVFMMISIRIPGNLIPNIGRLVVPDENSGSFIFQKVMIRLYSAGW